MIGLSDAHYDHCKYRPVSRIIYIETDNEGINTKKCEGKDGSESFEMVGIPTPHFIPLP
jgi:hypothetical protein